MKAAIITPGRGVSEILDHLNRLDPQFKPEVWPDVRNPEDISVALIWKTSDEILSKFPNLRLICSFGAGVDHLISKSSIPKSASITRLVDPKLSDSVSKYCIMSIIAYEKNFKNHILNKERKKWFWKDDIPQPAVGILGMGVIGNNLALKLNDLDYPINGYSLSPKISKFISHYTGSENLSDFLKASDVLINLMPLTSETHSFYDLEFFKQCKTGTYFINVGRGQHVVDKDLLEAIDKGFLSGATLDVFNEEPLPAEHPFWNSDHLTMTPHIAGLTAPKSAATQFYENYIRLRDGKSLLNQVDTAREY